MPAQPSSSSFAAGRSPGRLRTKTSDLSDILHGRTSSSKPSDSDIPPVPTTPLATPTKSKGKLAGFLARKRKSGGIPLSGGHDASVKEEDGTDAEHYPAVPQSLAASRIPSANQPSLPPLNVSPTSFGASFTSATETSHASRFSADPSSLLSVAPTSSTSKHRSAIPFRGLKSQKSTSFEVSRPFNVTHTATATNLAMVNGSTSRIPSVESKSKSSSGEGVPSKKPTITISAPPSTADIEEDKHIFNSPRAAPAPPSSVSSSSTPAKTSRASKDAHGVARKFGFGHHKKDKEELTVMSDPERSTKSREKSIPVASPTPSLSPMLPPKMHFPIPPKSNPLGGAQIVPTLTDAFQSLSPTGSSIATVSPHTATASDMSEGELSPSSSKGARATPSRPPRPSSLIIPTVNRSRANSANTISSTLTARSPPSSPSSPTPTYGRPAFPPSSRIRGASTSTNASVTGVGNRISTQHYSYSARSTNSTAIAPSPTSPPPMSPLPSPPTSPTSFPRSASGSGGALSSGEEVEVEAGWSTDASTRLGHGGWSTDASTRVGSLGGSLANMKKAALLGATESRVRANTITTTAASAPIANTVSGHSATRQRAGTSGGHPHPHYPTPASTYKQHASGVSSGEETNYESATSGRSILAGRKKTVHVLSSKVNDSTESVVGRPRAASQSSTQRDLPPLPAASAGQHDSSESTTPTRDDSNSNVSSSGLRAAHETFVRIMQEKHAAEKAELLRRIERLEREARKREREIKGLRWLVMNPTGGGGTGDHPAGGSIGQPYVALLALEEQLTAGRLRSGSKSSEFSAMSAGTASDTTRSRTSSGVDRSAHPATFSSPADSTEEGLMELQSEINDFIAPTQAYTRGPPVNSQSRGSEDQSDPRRDSSGSRRRSNTVPDREAAASATAKHARRTSSPLLPAGHGLGIVDADLPCIPSGSDMSLTTLGGATYGSIPSLCLSSTNSTSSMASSGISLATKASSANAIRQSPEPAKERRVSRLLKRISTSSTSSLSSASTSYAASNIKMRTSPSIEQVLDRAEVRAPIPGEARMDEALKKLRRFGGEGK